MIAYYVHHHGRGHFNRALAITRHLTDGVVFLSSLAPPSGLRPGDRWVQLPMDVGSAGDPPLDPTANGRLHWVPEHVDGLARRAALITQTLAAEQPRRIVVDVSVEVTLLARLAGIPVTVMAMPGERDDAAHRLAYDVADSIVAPWSDDVYRPSWSARYASRVHYVGSISRFDGRERPAAAPGAGPCGLLLAGAGGSAVPADGVTDLQAAVPELTWRAIGGTAGWVDDPWPMIAGADLVVSHAGQNAVADVALAEVPAIVVPENRPFDEQCSTAAALDHAGVAVSAPGWPTRDQWPDLVARARSIDRRGWRRLGAVGAPARAARVISA